ncbi:hypothetical protein T12_3365 [Trichinella patagoniensis]|uniref:CCHC-type domain-containing protein n=1 Tax=Trichinella patagoniensis TaxID=990121 RepID=A0A0V0Z5G3_9BILA|nr:hypothetical protein T12_3365 [Trichinella patagoniensis]
MPAAMQSDGTLQHASILAKITPNSKQIFTLSQLSNYLPPPNTTTNVCVHHTEEVPVICQQEFRTTFVTPALPLNAVVTVDSDKMSSQRLVGKLAFRSHGRVRLLASQGIDHRLGNRESSSVLCRTSRSGNTSVRSNGDSRSCCLGEPPEVDGVTAYGGMEVWFSLCAWKRKVCVGYLARPVRLLHCIRVLWSRSSASRRHLHEMSAHRGSFFLMATIFDRHPHPLLPPAHNHPPLQIASCHRLYNVEVLLLAGARCPTTAPGQRCFECGRTNHFTRDWLDDTVLTKDCRTHRLATVVTHWICTLVVASLFGLTSEDTLQTNGLVVQLVQCFAL